MVTRSSGGAEMVLDRLEAVRRVGYDRWMAKCPAHEDRRASLSVRALDDGRTLVHCFALCTAEEVLKAIGVDWSALFPVDWAGRKFNRAGVLAVDALAALEFEMSVALVVLGDILAKRPVSEADYDRLQLARNRISKAREATRAI